MKRNCCFPNCGVVLMKPLSKCWETGWEALSINGAKARCLCPEHKKVPDATDYLRGKK